MSRRPGRLYRYRVASFDFPLLSLFLADSSSLVRPLSALLRIFITVLSPPNPWTADTFSARVTFNASRRRDRVLPCDGSSHVPSTRPSIALSSNPSPRDKRRQQRWRRTSSRKGVASTTWPNCAVWDTIPNRHTPRRTPTRCASSLRVAARGIVQGCARASVRARDSQRRTHTPSPRQLRRCMTHWRYVATRLWEIEYCARRVVVARALEGNTPPSPPPSSSAKSIGNAFAMRDAAILEARRTRELLYALQNEFDSLRNEHAECLRQVSLRPPPRVADFRANRSLDVRRRSSPRRERDRHMRHRPRR